VCLSRPRKNEWPRLILNLAGLWRGAAALGVCVKEMKARPADRCMDKVFAGATAEGQSSKETQFQQPNKLIKQTPK